MATRFNRRDFIRVMTIGSGAVLVGDRTRQILAGFDGGKESEPNGPFNEVPTINADIVVRPDGNSSWKVDITRRDTSTKKIAIFELSAKELSGASSGQPFARVSKENIHASVGLGFNTAKNVYVEERDIVTDHGKFTATFGFDPDWRSVVIIHEGPGHIELPELKHGSLYIFAAFHNEFNPNTDSWKPFHANNNPDLRVETRFSI